MCVYLYKMCVIAVYVFERQSKIAVAVVERGRSPQASVHSSAIQLLVSCVTGRNPVA